MGDELKGSTFESKKKGGKSDREKGRSAQSKGSDSGDGVAVRSGKKGEIGEDTRGEKKDYSAAK